MASEAEEALRESLAGVPFETLLRLQQQSERKLASTVRGQPQAQTAAKTTQKTRRARDAPAELPSNVPVSRFRQVVHMPRKAPQRDPRFDDLSGAYNAGQFRKSYAFLDQLRDEEIAELRQEVSHASAQRRKRQTMDEEAVEEVEKTKRALSVLEQQKRNEAEAARRRASKMMWRKAMEERISRGGRVFFRRHRDEKREAAIAKYHALKTKGGSKSVEAAIERRERKKAAKQRKNPLFHSRPTTE